MKLTPFSADDDVASTSSTISVERAAKLPRRLSASASRKFQEKHVRFDERSNIVHKVPLVIKEDAWYTTPELKKLKLACVSDIKEILQSESDNTDEQCYVPCMTEMFKACCAVESEDDREELSPEHEVVFNDWVQGMIECIGIERALNRYIAKDKVRRRAKLLRKVENYQMICLAQGRRPDPQAIGDICRAISRPSRFFARRLATAHSCSKPGCC